MRRYGLLTALVYDVGSGERPLYRRGRRAAVAALHLRPGDHVLVLGVGTGLDLPLVAAAIGPTGEIVAVDESPAMLRSAAARARRARRHGPWPRLRLVQADATRARTLLPPGTAPVDAVLAVNTLSLIPDWRAAWGRAVAAAEPGARVAVADIGRPRGGPAIGAWSRLISLIGGGRLEARPWQAVEQEASDVESLTVLDGHVEMRAGALR